MQLFIVLMASVAILLSIIVLTRKVTLMNAQIQAIVDKVAQQTTVVAGLTTVVASVVAGLVALKAALDTAIANGGLSAEDQAALTGAVTSLQSDVDGVQSNSDELAAALIANTPAARRG